MPDMASTQTYETKKIKYIPGIKGRQGDAKLEKLIADGWELVSKDNHLFSKTTAVLRRAK